MVMRPPTHSFKCDKCGHVTYGFWNSTQELLRSYRSCEEYIDEDKKIKCNGKLIPELITNKKTSPLDDFIEY
jgi:hypothetical protein